MSALKLWRIDHDNNPPVLVECPNGRYPSRDADGFVVYGNSHFDTEEEAWLRLISEAQAFVESAGRRVIQAENYLIDANQNAGAAAKAYSLLRDMYEKSRERVTQLMPCGHSRENLVSDDEGTSYCAACENAAAKGGDE